MAGQCCVIQTHSVKSICVLLSFGPDIEDLLKLLFLKKEKEEEEKKEREREREKAREERRAEAK